MAIARFDDRDEADDLRQQIQAFRRMSEWAGPPLRPLCDLLMRETERKLNEVTAAAALLPSVPPPAHPVPAPAPPSPDAPRPRLPD